MSTSPLRPCLVVADPDGSIYDEPEILMVCRKGQDFSLPRPDELMPLPEGSRLFLLPGRKALGLDEEEGALSQDEALAVAAVPPAGHVLTAHPAWEAEKDCPALPAHPYGAVGFAHNRLYICAKKVKLPDGEAETPLPMEPDWHFFRTNSLREGVYQNYFGLEAPSLAAGLEAALSARQGGKKICLHFLFFPGFSDTEGEYTALEGAILELGIGALMLDNLPMAPDVYLALMGGIETGPAMGYANFCKRLKKNCPGLALVPAKA